MTVGHPPMPDPALANGYAPGEDEDVAEDLGDPWEDTPDFVYAATINMFGEVFEPLVDLDRDALKEIAAELAGQKVEFWGEKKAGEFQAVGEVLTRAIALLDALDETQPIQEEIE